MFEFKLPDLGEGIHEGQIVNVLVKEGETIAEYQPMLEVETDKAAVEIPSPRSGVVSKVNVKPGQVVKVGEVMLVIGDGGASAAKATPAARSAAAETAPAAAPAATPAREPAPAVAHRASESAAARPPAQSVAVAAAPVDRDGPVPAAPAVRKLAREMGVDLNLVEGSGPHGRVVREDVERFSLGHRPGVAARAAGASGDGAASGGGIAIPSEELPDFSQWGPVRREPASQIRKTIARQMTRAWLNVPRVTHGDISDITELERNRRRFNENLRQGQSKLTMTAIVAKAVAAALRDFPYLNCSFDAARGEVIFKDYIHLGVAVDTPRGLVVPVLRDVDRKGLPQISKELNELADRTRAGKFEISELRGATFTVTNVGSIGGNFATPMVNFPEAGILGLGKAEQQARVVDGQIVARLMMPLYLSFDHRMVDGADAARFTREVVNSLENPLRLISM